MFLISLTTIDYTLAGKYADGDGDLFVDFDSTLGTIVFTLPDVKSFGSRLMILKNSGANDVTVSTVNGQHINTAGAYSETMRQNEYLFMVNDGKSKWVTIDSTGFWR